MPSEACVRSGTRKKNKKEGRSGKCGKMWKNEVLGMKKPSLKIILATILFIAICLIALAMDLAPLAVYALVAGRLYG